MTAGLKVTMACSFRNQQVCYSGNEQIQCQPNVDIALNHRRVVTMASVSSHLKEYDVLSCVVSPGLRKGCA